MVEQPLPPRFLTLDQVADELALSRIQVYALVRRGDLEAAKFGGRGQWRVERPKLEEYLAQVYDDTRRYLQEHPYRSDDEASGKD